MNLKKYFFYVVISFLLMRCASYKAQYADKNYANPVLPNKKITHSFYLIGDAGNADINKTIPSLVYLKKALATVDKNSTLLFLGDNVYLQGVPKENSKGIHLAKHRLQTQLEVAKNFKGRTIFIPGNHDWRSGVKGLKRQEKLVEKILGKGSFLPENGCGLKKVKISDNLVLIVIDSRWFISDWNDQPTINEDCGIKTRERFLDELSSFFKKSRYKNVVVAMHHPLYSNGPHGGSFSVSQHLFALTQFGGPKIPIPGLGSFLLGLRANAGIPTDLHNKNYAHFIKSIKKIAEKFKKNIVFVAGHEHNLQYLKTDGFMQIISGSGSKRSPAKIGYGAAFTYGNLGYAKLNYYADGTAVVSYYSANKKDGNTLLFRKEIISPEQTKTVVDFPEYQSHKKFVTLAIYNPKDTKVGKFHKFLWGDLNREKYRKKVKVPVLALETVFGGLNPIRQGGGNQTSSLRLENPQGKQYVLRSMIKDGSRLMGGALEGTFLVKVMQDVFTMANPYAAFVIPSMADAVNIYHTNPKLYYLPKQPNLGKYNARFGGGLYLLEERPSGDRSDLKNFGNSKKISSTFDILEKIRKDGKHRVDQHWVIRSRLFDMLIGDWDRHEDQWRWASFKTNNGNTSYRPIPRDRDQPFSKFDGILIPIFKLFVPMVRNMQTFKGDVKNMKWYNNYARFFDEEFLSELTLEDWLQQAKFIQKNLTDSIIEKAIRQFPKPIFELDGQEIIAKIKSRRNKLQEIAKRYYVRRAKVVQVIGTDKKDKFVIKRLNDKQTEVSIFQKKQRIYHRIFKVGETKEIQLYGLNGADTFLISGKVNKGILIRIIGGQGKDTFTDTSTVKGWRKKTKIYDALSKKNTLIKSTETADLRSDNYFKNTYNHRDIQKDMIAVMPKLGSNPDDGFSFGASITYTKYGFKKRPFSSWNKLDAKYYNATKGYNLEYNAEFTELIGNWALRLNAKVSSPNYSINFFGWGNQSNYPRENNLNYYRIKKQEISFTPSLLKRLKGGSTLEFLTTIQGIKIENTKGRFIHYITSATDIFKMNYFAGGAFRFTHKNLDNKSFPTKGMDFNFTVGAKMNLKNTARIFGYLKIAMTIYQNLVPNRSLVFASRIGTELNFGNRFEIYQAVTLGGNKTLRGFNQERFTGKESFFHSNDLRLRLGSFKTVAFPMKLGVSAGFDYGKVWMPNLPSTRWHTSYGGSVWLNGLDLFTANLSFFRGNDNNRIAFSIGFNF